MFDLICIKPACRAPYQSDDPEPYYCPSCEAENKRLAQEIDAKVAARPKKPIMSELQAYDASPKVRGFVHVKL